MSIQMKVYGGMFAIGALVYGVSEVDKSLNYVETDAKITAAEFDCYIENSSGRIVEKKTDNLAFMSCDIAPIIAAQHGYKDSDISQRVKMEYSYYSPVDGSVQYGKHETKYNASKYQKGAVIKIFAHKEEPGKTRFD